jgi:regulation of enolase protein 1 (concanavalin A-like superfamily)
MFRTLCPIVLLLAAITVGIAAPVKEKKAQTIKGWGTVVDPDRDCKVTLDEGKVTITVPITCHDLTYQEDGTKRNAPRILQDLKGDFRVQVKVRVFPLPQENTSSSGKFSFVSSGLLMWIDDKNFLRLERAAEGSSQGPFLRVERFENGRPVTNKNARPSVDNDTWLRMDYKDGKLTYSFSEDGKEWKELHAEELKLPEKVKVGVHAINTTTVTFSPTLEELKVEKK